VGPIAMWHILVWTANFDTLTNKKSRRTKYLIFFLLSFYTNDQYIHPAMVHIASTWLQYTSTPYKWVWNCTYKMSEMWKTSTFAIFICITEKKFSFLFSFSTVCYTMSFYRQNMSLKIWRKKLCFNWCSIYVTYMWLFGWKKGELHIF